MPVVTKEQLKIWFSNLKKPPEGEFWAWLDSYRHILDKVPLDDVEGLTEKLQKKADLVDGVVPENQLPFSVVTSEVITLGLVSVVDNELDLAVHSSGANKVRVKGKKIVRTFPNSWNFTPIQNNGVKVIRGFAEKNQVDFFISEGAELPEFELPEIPEDALQLFIVTITQAGATIDTGGDSGFKYKAESGWKSLLITSNNPRWITLTSDESTFEITEQNASTPLISGLLTKGGKWIYPGKVYGLFNASGRDVTIRRNDVRPPFNPIQIANYLTFLTTEDILVKPGEYFWFKIKGAELVALKFGGSASFPAIGNDGDVLELDNSLPEKVKWVEKATKNAIADFIHYWNSTTMKWASSGVKIITGIIPQLEFSGRIKAKSVILPMNADAGISNELGYDGTHVVYGDTKRNVAWQSEAERVFIYTPTGNFTISAVKIAIEEAGQIFNDCHIIIILAANNFTCSIDIGSANPNKLFTIARRGNGSLSFTSTRTLNSGIDAITIMNGNEFSMALVQFGTSADALTIKNK